MDNSFAAIQCWDIIRYKAKLVERLLVILNGKFDCADAL
jgi:hypothetical protein